MNTPWNGSVGFPFPSTVVSIRGEGFKDLGFWTTPQEIPEHTGEICVKGPQVMRGYWDKPEETAAVLRDGLAAHRRYRQYGQQRPHYNYRPPERHDSVSGFNVYPNEIEGVLQSMPEILECGVVGVPNEKSGERVKAVIVKKDPSLTVEQVKAYCRQNLTGYKMPKEIVFVDSIPKTPVGKILRRELKDIVAKEEAPVKQETEGQKSEN